jgi:hypothetical protein
MSYTGCISIANALEMLKEIFLQRSPFSYLVLFPGKITSTLASVKQKKSVAHVIWQILSTARA